MHFQLPIAIPKLEPAITYNDKIYLCGSCFSNAMHGYFNRHKFQVKQSAHGIVFNPLSVCKSLQDVVSCKQYQDADLFFMNEYWHSWFHHSDFSALNQNDCLQLINQTIQEHHAFLKEARFAFLTLGSAFAYWHLEEQLYVSNNHRAPAAVFRKDLLPLKSIVSALRETEQAMLQFNPNLRIVYTISPVRHIRDGVMENNRSKSRLFEAVYSLEQPYYFPSYELVMDVLRDYRFYDADLVHPNYQATQFVWEKLVESCMAEDCLPVMKLMDQLYKAYHHKPKDTRSKAHRNFLQQHYALCQELQHNFPQLDFREELAYFSSVQ